MKDSILELIGGQNNLTWQVILMNILFSALFRGKPPSYIASIFLIVVYMLL